MTQQNDFFDAKLTKGDIIGAIDQAILLADQSSEMAREAIKSLDDKMAQIRAIRARAAKLGKL